MAEPEENLPVDPVKTGAQAPEPAAAPGLQDFALSELDKKALQILGDKVVVKKLAQQTVFDKIPRYVSEYLLAKYVKIESHVEDLARMQSRIKQLLPSQDEGQVLRNKLMSTGEVVVIDNVEARVDLKNQQRLARVPALGEDKVRVPAELLNQNVGLLLGGLWGTVKVRYTPETDAARPIEMTAFTPFQVGPPDLAAHKAMRPKFTTDEWMSLMCSSVGYQPEAYPTRRAKLLLFARLTTLVESNINMLELGPRQTGKTFLLRNLSPRVFVISGGKTSPANLFVNLATKSVGILGTRKVVVFDEIAHTEFGDEGTTISTLKDFMESGNFSRGSLQFTSDASIVLGGNLDVTDGQPASKYRHLFEPLPKELHDTAFHDRVHAFLPGWEMPKITPQSIASGVGFVTDYLGELLVKLRDDDHKDRMRSLKYQAGMTKRDQTAIERVGSGLIKLIYPDGVMTPDELNEVADLACEMRQRVHNQLSKLAPGEFKPRLIAREGLEWHTAVDLAPKA